MMFGLLAVDWPTSLSPASGFRRNFDLADICVHSVCGSWLLVSCVLAFGFWLPWLLFPPQVRHMGHVRWVDCKGPGHKDHTCKECFDNDVLVRPITDAVHAMVEHMVLVRL